MPTPPDPEQPPPGPVLEPVRVVRLRRFDALAELMREIRPDPATQEDDTQELPPVPAPAAPRSTPPCSVTPATATPGPRQAGRRAVVAVAVAAAALAGFGCALLLPGRQQAAATARPAPPATTAPPATAAGGPPTPAASTEPTTPATAPDPDGPGTLRQGDAGSEVADLQQRLLRIPDVYRDGATDGTYDATLTEAVARFQLWYGVSGDETGVYGNDTRRALESRTGFGDDS
ncbi:peptidoglycan-binding domain-containing protein [Streptomyces flaveolus]|uniref:peptidoglycan-binding domain-containing protein n=1 Tax=Streptomyces flaveolus TaxID=67297 RepID=UPI00344A32DA